MLLMPPIYHVEIHDFCEYLFMLVIFGSLLLNSVEDFCNQIEINNQAQEGNTNQIVAFIMR